MSDLTGRELLLRTLSRQPVDCIPVSPFIHVNYVKEFFGSNDVDWVARTPEVYRHFGFHVMHRNCTPVYEAYGPPGPDWQVEVAVEPDGRDETKTTVIRTPRGDLRCVEALRWTYEYDAEASAVEYMIKSEADLDLMMAYQPAHGPADTNDIGRAREAAGEDGITAPWIQGAFNLVAYYYRKVDDLLADALLNPAFYDRLMTWALERYMGFLGQVIAAGPDVLSMGGNIANGKMVGSGFFREHIWPYERRLIEFIQGRGVAVLYHNCGYARRLLPLYPSLGMRAYESLTPPPYGDTILAEAVETFGQGTALLGNMDQLDLLRKGTAEEITAQVKQVLDTVRGRSHFILATTDYFNENTPHENIHALADAGRRFGGSRLRPSSKSD
jgi:uroporphyrinogen-III decarboxylase